jgi:DNA helicase HerA-like ATPase
MHNYLPPIFDTLAPEHSLLIVGKTGTGKSRLLASFVARQAQTARSVVLLDPHGDLADDVLRDIPRFRKNDVIVIDPTDPSCRGVNPFRGVDAASRPLVVANVLSAIRKLFDDSAWGMRTEYLLRNSFLAAAELRGGTIADAARLLTDLDHRRWVLQQVNDAAVLDFFMKEMPGWGKSFAAEAVTAPVNKLAAILASPDVRHVLTKTKPRLDISATLRRNPLLIASLKKGSIGEDASRFLGGLLLGMVQTSVFARANEPRELRKPLRIVVDEATSFPAPVLLELLAEGRKFGASLVIATQSLSMLPDDVRAGLTANIAATVAFRVGGEDGRLLSAEFSEIGVPTLTSLPPGDAIVRVGHHRPVLVHTWA